MTARRHGPGGRSGRTAAGAGWRSDDSPAWTNDQSSARVGGRSLQEPTRSLRLGEGQRRSHPYAECHSGNSKAIASLHFNPLHVLLVMLERGFQIM